MKIKLIMVAVLISAALILASCQQVFTSSVYTLLGYSTDMSSMTDEQKVSYAQDLLSSGSAEDMQTAYDEIFAMLGDDLSTADPELVLLAADLAVGASGLGDAVTDGLELLTSGSEDADAMASLIEGIDTDNLADAVTLMEAAEASGTDITEEQYANAAAAQLLVAADGDINNLDFETPDDDLQQALDWAVLGGVDLESLFAGG